MIKNKKSSTPSLGGKGAVFINGVKVGVKMYLAASNELVLFDLFDH